MPVMTMARWFDLALKEELARERSVFLMARSAEFKAPTKVTRGLLRVWAKVDRYAHHRTWVWGLAGGGNAGLRPDYRIHDFNFSILATDQY